MAGFNGFAEGGTFAGILKFFKKKRGYMPENKSNTSTLKFISAKLKEFFYENKPIRYESNVRR
ncbi:MAG: hypothetical protein WCH01_15035 [Methylococcaceae bacterium]